MERYIKVNDIFVREDVFTTKFCCDYEKCKGACCYGQTDIIEEVGGWVTKKEAKTLFRNRELLSEFSDDDCKADVLDNPCDTIDGCLYTKLKGCKCVLSSLKHQNCICVLANKVNKRIEKPEMCALSPIIYNCGELYIEISHPEICKCAFEKGERENIYIIDFLGDVIRKQFGEDFFKKLLEVRDLQVSK